MTAQIGLQLYTVRTALADDLSGTLRQVAEAGYTGVETAFFAEDVVLADAAKQIRDLGMTIFAAHTALPIDDDHDAVLRLSDALDCQRIVWHGWPRDDRYDSIDGVRELATALNIANDEARSHGLTLGIHNHWWECEPVGETYPLAIFRDELDETIFFEFDAYWSQVAGREPAAVVTELGSRMPLLHLKDGPLRRGEPMVAVGTGELDIPQVLAATGAELEWVVVELDEVAGDVFEAITLSRAYLASHLS